MIVENKKTKHRFSITQEDWNRLKELGKTNLFKVVSNETFKPNVVEMPKEIQEFINKVDRKQTKKTGK